MGRFPNVIYAMNENLLDAVEADKVSDEDESVAEYTFLFYFNSDKNPKIVMDTFFGSVMEPALDMMKSRGLLESWDFDRTNGRIEDFPLIGLFMDCMYNESVSSSDMPSFVLSLAVRFPEPEESTEFLGTVSAVLMQYALSSGISMDGNMMESFWRTGDSLVYSVFYEIDKRKTTSGDWEKWVFHCGRDCSNSLDLCETFAGCFVKKSGKLGIVKPVDDAGTRYVVYSFGKDAGNQMMYFIASDGTCLNEFTVVLAVAAHGRFLDNGLMYVDFSGRYKNYLRMNGTTWQEYGYMCDSVFSEGFVSVMRTGADGYAEGNFLDKDGDPLLDEWCKRTERFVDGIAIVVKEMRRDWRTERKHNVVDTEGHLLFKEWYDDIRFEEADGEPDDGCKRTVARVRKSSSGSLIWNYVDRSGNLLSKEWFDGHCGCMVNGFAELSKITVDGDTIWNYMRENGSLMSKNWFERVLGWPEDGIFAFKSKKNGHWQFMDTETGKVMFGGCVFGSVAKNVCADGFRYYVVRTAGSDGKDMNAYCNLVSSDGVMCRDKTDMWDMNYVGNGLVLASKSYFSKKEILKFGKGPVELGRLVSHACRLGDSEYAVVTSVDKYTVIDKDGNLVSDIWYEHISTYMRGGFVEVWSYGDGRHIEKMMNILSCKSGKLLFRTGEELPCRICGAVPDKVVIVEKQDSVLKYNIFDCDGNMLLDEWTDFRICATEDGRVLRVGPSAYVDCSGNTVCLI